MKRSRGARRKLAYAIVVPPFVSAPVCILLYVLGVSVDAIKDVWYAGMFAGSIWLANRDGTSLSQIGLTKRRCGTSLALAAIWETVTFFLVGVPIFFLVAGRWPSLMTLDSRMVYPALHFMLVGLGEETWFRGLIMRRLLDSGAGSVAAVVSSTALFLLFHVPASAPMLFQNPGLMPLYLTSMSSLFLWSAGFAVIALKTGNIVGPVVLHAVDDFASKILYPLSI